MPMSILMDVDDALGVGDIHVGREADRVGDEIIDEKLDAVGGTGGVLGELDIVDDKMGGQ